MEGKLIDVGDGLVPQLARLILRPKELYRLASPQSISVFDPQRSLYLSKSYHVKLVHLKLVHLKLVHLKLVHLKLVHLKLVHLK